eukprot:SAG11_NODE_2185_length_3711_cov_1.448228_2_plen_143_part_00
MQRKRKRESYLASITLCRNTRFESIGGQRPLGLESALSSFQFDTHTTNKRTHRARRTHARTRASSGLSGGSLLGGGFLLFPPVLAAIVVVSKQLVQWHHRRAIIAVEMRVVKVVVVATAGRLVEAVVSRQGAKSQCTMLYMK